MKEKNHPIHDALDGVIAAAVSKALADQALADNVTKAVLEAIEAYEDERFLRILEQETDEENIPVEAFLDSLKR